MLHIQATNRFHYEAAIGRVCSVYNLQKVLFPFIRYAKSNGEEPSLYLYEVVHKTKYRVWASDELKSAMYTI